MLAGDLERFRHVGRIEEGGRATGDFLEELLLDGSESRGSVGEDELRDRKEAVLEDFSARTKLRRGGRRGGGRTEEIFVHPWRGSGMEKLREGRKGLLWSLERGFSCQ